jgi:hypothetical protein
MLMQKGLSVRARTRSASRCMASGCVYANPKAPSAPASETLATSSGVVTPPAIGAWMTGTSIPSCLQRGVITRSLLE